MQKATGCNIDREISTPSSPDSSEVNSNSSHLNNIKKSEGVSSIQTNMSSCSIRSPSNTNHLEHTTFEEKGLIANKLLRKVSSDPFNCTHRLSLSPHTFSPGANFVHIIATEQNSGICEDHIAAIKNFCKTTNLFLFIRPTELASTRLIKLGYATKSMDIHHKSANGGIAKGFVPVDPAFSKNGKNIVPTQNISLGENHNKALQTQLFLPSELLDMYAQEMDEYVLTENSEKFIIKNSEFKANVSEINTRYFVAKPEDNSPNQVLYIANKQSDNSAKWNVSWVHMNSSSPTSADISTPSTITPLYVFAYKLASGEVTPVTGDYDIAAFIPDHSDKYLDGTHKNILDMHGESRISDLGQWIAEKINLVCQRQDNPVIRHGAEMQNIHFAQPLDDNLVCFTPTHKALIISKENTAKAQYDLLVRGYLIKWNPAYEQDNLPLNGKSCGIFELQDTSVRTVISQRILKNKIQELRTLYLEKYTNELNDLNNSILEKSDTLNLNETTDSNILDNTIILQELLTKILAPDSKHALKLCDQLLDIVKYHSELSCLLQCAETVEPMSFHSKLKYFNTTDIPNSRGFVESIEERTKLISMVRNIVKNTKNPNYKPSTIEINNFHGSPKRSPSLRFFDDQQLPNIENNRMAALKDAQGAHSLSPKLASKRHGIYQWSIDRTVKPEPTTPSTTAPSTSSAEK